MVRGLGVAGQRAQRDSAVFGRLDARQLQPVDVDQRGGLHDVQLHQVGEIGAAGDEAGVAARGAAVTRIADRGHCGVDVGGTAVGDGVHAGTVPVTTGARARSSTTRHWGGPGLV